MHCGIDQRRERMARLWGLVWKRGPFLNYKKRCPVKALIEVQTRVLQEVGLLCMVCAQAPDP